MTRGGSADMSSFCVAAVLGASSWWFATRVRSARGTDRDIPASFLRSCSGRMPSLAKCRSKEIHDGREKAQVPGSLDVQSRTMR